MKLHFPTISIHQDTTEICEAIRSANHGIVLLSDLPPPSFSQVQGLLDHLAYTTKGKAIAQELNKAYSKNLVYKDSFADGTGGPKVDLKRVLDLSPERLEVIRKVQPELLEQDSKELQETLSYWDDLTATYASKLLEAVAHAITGQSCEDKKNIVTNDAAFNYRMVDYYPRSLLGEDDAMEPPRCSEHRDFSTFTIISTTGPGLQVYHDGIWHNVPWDTPVLLFGWCTQIRSNGRIPAALHRVVDNNAEEDVRRTSMVLFCAPKQHDTTLEPVVWPGETQQYMSGIQVGQLRGNMARKWKHREGTLNEQEKILEEEEIRATNLKTQDDVVKCTVPVI